MGDWLREVLDRRPMWLNVLLGFSAFMAVIYVPWDLFLKPLADDEEVWFGIVFEGAAAKLLAIPHWIVYGASAYGLWRMKSWCWPWLSVYWGQVALGMFIWQVRYVGGFGAWLTGLVTAGLVGWLAVALWRARPLFEQERGSLRERYGDWAVVTGASAGIGLEFARALAREGISCVLTARREDRLQQLADDLEKNHQVSTRVVGVDLAEPGGSDELADAIQDLEIGILVNNAGFGYAGRFDKLEAERLRQMVNLNCLTPVLLTKRLLPAMQARGRGAIIITGSVAGRQPLPLHGVYSATKVFDQFLGESLWAELQGTGIDVLVLEPGSTESEFHSEAGELPHPGEPAHQVVAVALDALGQQPSVISGWFNWVRAQGIRLLPRSLAALVAKSVVEPQTPAEMR